MNVLITGATGFTGSYVLRLLQKKEFHIRCLVHRSSNTSGLTANQIELVYGDLGDIGSLKRALQNIDAFINIASIGFGHAPNIVQACLTAGVQRALFVSTTAIFTTLNAPSKSVRLDAEHAICASGLAYTILRPTMIYGSSRDRNMCRLIRYLQRWPIIPIFGNGKYLQQPVYVEDVAKALVEASITERTIGKAYDIAGASALTYNQVIDTICELLRRKVRKVHIPASPIVACLGSMERLGLNLPIKGEQILRLNEDKAFDFDEATKDFGYAPRSFVEGISLELEEMGISSKKKQAKGGGINYLSSS
jgi:uncharacterized protein YbjT (DUF2867 family)